MKEGRAGAPHLMLVDLMLLDGDLRSPSRVLRGPLESRSTMIVKESYTVFPKEERAGAPHLMLLDGMVIFDHHQVPQRYTRALFPKEAPEVKLSEGSRQR